MRTPTVPLGGAGAGSVPSERGIRQRYPRRHEGRTGDAPFHASPVARQYARRMTDVRVGIVSYNTATLLERCLMALPAALDGLAAEVVVVDNASTDGSVALARSFSGVTVVAGERNVGYAVAMNRALATTSAPVLVALNPDTEPAPGALARLVGTLMAEPTVGLVAPVLRNPDGSLQHSVHRFPSVRQALVVGFVPVRLRSGWLGRRYWLEGFAPHDRCQTIDWAIGATHAIRRAALEEPDRPYRERWFMYAEDIDLCWRLRRSGWRVLLDPRAEVVHVGNAAGQVAWGETRDARWLAATYDWYAMERGWWAARAWALANSAGLSTKLAMATALRRPELVMSLRQLLPLHLAELVARPARRTAPAPVGAAHVASGGVKPLTVPRRRDRRRAP